MSSIIQPANHGQGTGRAAPILPLRLENISLQVRDTRILDNINLTIDAGGCVALMGFNGAGKSALLRIINGLIRPTSGRLVWASALKPRQLVKRQAMVFQHPVLLRRSVEDNLMYALDQHGYDRAQRSARLGELLALADLKHLQERPARALSGGERQRVAMARALSFQPELMLLDEPTASLDPGSTGAIETLIRSATDLGTTVVLVTHDRGQSKRLARRVIFLHRGQVVEDSSREAFFTRPESPAGQAFNEGRLPDA